MRLLTLTSRANNARRGMASTSISQAKNALRKQMHGRVSELSPTEIERQCMLYLDSQH